MSYYVLGPDSDVRICYVRAWDDAQWCEQNGVPTPAARRTAKRSAETRAHKRDRQVKR